MTAEPFVPMISFESISFAASDTVRKGAMSLASHSLPRSSAALRREAEIQRERLTQAGRQGGSNGGRPRLYRLRRDPPDPQWPGRARIAVNINLNFEGGGERSIMEGDGVSEGVLNDIGLPSLAGVRSPLVESVFEYGSRVGGWRLLRLFRRFGVKICCLAVAKAAERNPELTRAFVEDGHEIVSHGYRWLDYQTMPEEVEREHVRLGIEAIERIAGVRPVGWMTGRPSANTRRLHRRARRLSLRPRRAQ